MEPDLYITPEEYEIAEKNGIPYRNLNVRVRELFWDKERAITEPLQKGKPTPWKEWKEVCLRNGIGRWTFVERLKIGWEPEKAATEPVRDRVKILAEARSKKIIITDEILEVMKKNNLRKSTVHGRLYRGWTLEAAITTPTLSPSEVGRRAGKASKMKKSV